MGYRDDVAGGDESYGIYLAKPDAKHKVYFPSWDTENYKPTTFRIFGPPTADLKDALPVREGPAFQAFGDWIRARHVFRCGSAERVTFIMDTMNASGTKLEFGADNPCRILQEAYQRGSKDDEHTRWLRLEKGGKGRGAGLQLKNKKFGFLQGALFAHNGKTFKKPSFPVLLVLTPSARFGLEKLVDEEVPGYAGDPTDYDARYKVGNFLDPNAGKLLNVYSKASANAAKGEQSAANVDWSGPGAGDEEKKESADDKMYACDMVPGKPLPRLSPGGPLLIDSQGNGWQPWNQVLRYLTHAEQVEMLIRAFDDYPDLLKYAFHERGLLPPAWYEKQAERAARKAQVQGSTLGAAATTAKPPTTPTTQAAPVAPTGAATAAAGTTAGPVGVDEWGTGGGAAEDIQEEGAVAKSEPLTPGDMADFGEQPGAAVETTGTPEAQKPVQAPAAGVAAETNAGQGDKAKAAFEVLARKRKEKAAFEVLARKRKEKAEQAAAAQAG